MFPASIQCKLIGGPPNNTPSNSNALYQHLFTPKGIHASVGYTSSTLEINNGTKKWSFGR